MKIKLIDFGLEKDHYPFRPHENDAGADVYMPYDCTLKPGEIARIPLGFGLMIPDGYAGYVFPRSSMAAKGLVCELPPIDSGYRGEIHAIISNVSSEVSAKYCYAAHESRLHQNDRCKRFALCLVLTVRFRSLAPWGKLFQLFI